MIFYVGKTTAPVNERYIQHLSDAKTRKNRTRVATYISQLSKPPVIQVIDTVMCNNIQERHASELESFWIKGLLSCGLPLVNYRLQPKRLKAKKVFPISRYTDPLLDIELLAC